MTWRAVLLGLLAGLGISAFTYLNDIILGQTRLIGSAFPISVFGGAAVLLLGINPLLRWFGRRGPLRPAEAAVSVAIALAACSYPGQSFYEYFVSAIGLPAHQQQSSPSWHAAQLMSYVPGGSPELAAGFVRDWEGFAAAVIEARDEDPLLDEIWAGSNVAERALWERAGQGESLNAADQDTLLRSVNRALASGAWSPEVAALPSKERVAAGRAALVEALPGVILPPPRGEGAILNGGQPDDRIVSPLVMGLNTKGGFPVGAVPWEAWWPSIRTWVGGSLLLSLALLCLAVIVHPQWSRRELLAFPVARFLDELARRSTDRAWPDVAYNRLFWIGFGSLAALHLVNGLHTWFPQLPMIPRTFDLNPLRELFPTISRTPWSGSVFNPTIVLSVVGFAFFVGRSVSLSLGLAPYLFALLAAALLSYGVPVGYERYQPNDMNFLRLGAYAAIVGMLIYTGRRYYGQVARGAVGLSSEAPGHVRWAARGLALFLPCAIAVYGLSGLSPMMATLFVLLLVMVYVVQARIVCETGMFLMAGPFAAVGILPAIFGQEAMGLTQIILLGVIGFVLMGDIKESLLPMALNGLEMTRRTGTSPPRAAPWLGVMVVLGCVVALVASVTLSYEHGIQQGPNSSEAIYGSGRTFDYAARVSTELQSLDRLGESTGLSDLERLTRMEPDFPRLTWALIGAAATIACGVARLRVPWWPLHPVVFVLLGTWGIAVLGFSFLVGWAVSAAVSNIGGAKLHRELTPLMIGIIAGELVAGLGWMLTGWAYHFATGQPPAQYIIFSP